MTSDEHNLRKSVLIVEDEMALAEVVRDYIVDAYMDAEMLPTGLGAVERALSGDYDIVVLDLMLPGKDGLTICREIRRSSMIPIIMVTAKVEEIDRLLGLELGADDYLCKPFSPRELVARIKAILRRSAQASTINAAGKKRLTLDSERWTAVLDGKLMDLTRREFKLLEILRNRPGRVYSRSQLLDLAFPDDADVIDRTIDSHIKNIRAKIKLISDWEPIGSIYGVGYAFDE